MADADFEGRQLAGIFMTLVGRPGAADGRRESRYGGLGACSPRKNLSLNIRIKQILHTSSVIFEHKHIRTYCFFLAVGQQTSVGHQP